MRKQDKRLDITPVRQMDGNSCGFCAMGAVYNYYGVDKSGLRGYLGTDAKFIPYNLPYKEKIEELITARIPGFKHTNGTLPQDMMAVLFKDGFKTTTSVKFDRNAIGENIEGGHPVLALIGDFGHWIVISGIDDRGVWITDSLSDKVYHETDYTFKETLNGLIFVERAKNARKMSFSEMGNADFAREYARATSFCIEMWYAAGKDYVGMKLSGSITKDRRRQTIVGNWINGQCGWKEGSIVGNMINNFFG